MSSRTEPVFESEEAEENTRNVYIHTETQVESPLSPHNSSAPASLSQGVAKALQGLHLEEQAGLLIEEVLNHFHFH